MAETQQDKDGYTTFSIRIRTWIVKVIEGYATAHSWSRNKAIEKLLMWALGIADADNIPKKGKQ